MTEAITLFAFDIRPDGTAKAIVDIDTAAPEAIAWRWLHFDAHSSQFRLWAEAHLPEAAAQALTEAKTRPRCDPLDDGLILTLRAINRNPGEDADDMVSVRLWITTRLVVSARSRRVFAAEDLRDRFTAGKAPTTPAGFLNLLTQLLTERIDRVSLDLEDQTDEMEDKILAGKEASDELAELRATAIKLRRHVGPQHVALGRLATLPGALIGRKERADLVEVANRTTRMTEELDAIAQRLTALQDHATAQLTARLSRNSFILSVVAAVFLPLGFLTGLFGVNVGGIPGQNDPTAFLTLALVSIGLGLLLVLVFRLLRWF